MDSRWTMHSPSPHGLIRPVRVDPAGREGPTRGAARGPHWRNLGAGWFVEATAPSLPEQRIVEAAVRLADGGAVSGWAACRMHGAGFFDGVGADGRTELPVALVVGPGSGKRPGPGLIISRDRLDPAEVVVRHGVPCTTPERAVFDAIRWAKGLREALVAFDLAAGAGLTRAHQMETYAAGRGGWIGVEQVRGALGHASERVRSPAETRLRLIWTLDAGLPRPLVNWQIADSDGRFLAEVDLLDPIRGLVGEYDGAHHRSGARHARDVQREDALRRAGLEVVTVTGRDLARPRAVVDRIHAAKERAARIPQERKTFLIKMAGKTGSTQPL